jgi:anti-sigma factor RsiW
MRCEEYQAKVEDYFDSEVDEQEAYLLAQHMNACPSCASIYARLEREQELYLRYECDAAAAPAFWDTVMQRAAQQESSRPNQSLSLLRGWFGHLFSNFGTPRFSPSLTALIVLVAVGITALVMNRVNTREKVVGPISISQSEAAPVSIPSPTRETILSTANQTGEDETGGKGSLTGANEQQQLVPVVGRRKANPNLVASGGSVERINRKTLAIDRARTPDELVREAEQKYVAAIAMLSRDASRRRSRLDAETAAQFERTLSAVDRNIADTRRAARNHPNDPVAARYMLTAYAKKVDVLREMIGY